MKLFIQFTQVILVPAPLGASSLLFKYRNIFQNRKTKLNLLYLTIERTIINCNVQRILFVVAPWVLNVI